MYTVQVKNNCIFYFFYVSQYYEYYVSFIKKKTLFAQNLFSKFNCYLIFKEIVSWQMYFCMHECCKYQVLIFVQRVT